MKKYFLLTFVLFAIIMGILGYIYFSSSMGILRYISYNCQPTPVFQDKTYQARYIDELITFTQPETSIKDSTILPIPPRQLFSKGQSTEYCLVVAKKTTNEHGVLIYYNKQGNIKNININNYFTSL